VSDVDVLVRFVRDNLATDELIARASMGDPSREGAGVWTRECSHEADDWCGLCREVVGDIHIYDEGGHDADDVAHIARQDPKSTLERVAAQRRLCDELAYVSFNKELVLRALACQWPDAEGFREEWGA
jgi:hypothetical protein